MLTCSDVLSSVLSVHCTAAGNASFISAAESGTGDALTRVSNRSSATFGTGTNELSP